MKRCCAYKCTNKGIYRFPEDRCLQKLWVREIQPKHWTPESRFRLCADHFKPDDFEDFVHTKGSKRGKKVLKKTAIPSKFVQRKKKKLRKELGLSQTMDNNNILPSYAEQSNGTITIDGTKGETRPENDPLMQISEKIKEETSLRSDYEELVIIEILEPQQNQNSQESEQKIDQINPENKPIEHNFSKELNVVKDLSDTENKLISEKTKVEPSLQSNYEELVNIQILESQQKQNSQESEQKIYQINPENKPTEHNFSKELNYEKDSSDSENELVIDETVLNYKICEIVCAETGVITETLLIPYEDKELNEANGEIGTANAQLTTENDSVFCDKKIEGTAEIDLNNPEKSMKSPGVILFFDKCRLCLDMSGEKIIDTTDLQDDVFNCTGVKVSPSDNLPQKICLQCLDIVNKCKALRELATENDLHLRSIFDEKADEESNTKKINTQTHSSSNNEQIVDSTVIEPDFLAPIPRRSTRIKRNVSASDSEDVKPNIKRAKLSVRTDIYRPNTIVIRTSDDYQKNKDRIKANDGTDNIIYECEICNKTCAGYKKLYLHKRYHTKDVKCKFEGCNKMFSNKGDMTKHLVTHTGTKPYVCEICNKTCAGYKKLYLHKRYHTKDVKCKFEGCNKMFSNKGDMTKHLLTHTGTKPYVCEKCGRGFSQRVNMRRHMEHVCTFRNKSESVKVENEVLSIVKPATD